MSPFELLVLVGASFALTRAWYRGSLFSAARQYAKAWKDMPTGFCSHAGHLLDCPLCLSFNLCVLLGPLFWLPGTAGLLCEILLYSIAASSLVPLSFLRNVEEPMVPEKEIMPEEVDNRLLIRSLLMKELERACEASVNKYPDEELEVVVVAVIDKKKKSLQTGCVRLIFPLDGISVEEKDMMHILAQMGSMQTLLCQHILSQTLAANKKANSNGTDAEEGQDTQRTEDNPHPT
jgi:hypothetical protein